MAEYALSIGFDVLELDFSPIRGPEGNIEYLIHLKKRAGSGQMNGEVRIEETVERAFDTLTKS